MTKRQSRHGVRRAPRAGVRALVLALASVVLLGASASAVLMATSGRSRDTAAGPSRSSVTDRAAGEDEQPSAPTAPPTAAPSVTRPTPSTPVTSATTGSAPTSTPPADIAYAFPIERSRRADFAHVHHDYPATDVFAPCGARFLAVTGGVVVAVSAVDRWNARTNLGADRGGLSVTLLGDDGVRYYGSHLQSVVEGIRVGARVRAGEVLGRVGRSGNAAATACHVHFGISPNCTAPAGEWWIRRGTVFPWPYLEDWRKGRDRSPVAAVRAWRAEHGCPAHPGVDP